MTTDCQIFQAIKLVRRKRGDGAQAWAVAQHEKFEAAGHAAAAEHWRRIEEAVALIEAVSQEVPSEVSIVAVPSTEWHEAGHVAVMLYFDVSPRRISVVVVGDDAGNVEPDYGDIRTKYGQEDESLQKLRYLRMRSGIRMAGVMAHDMIEPDHPELEGDQRDRKEAREIVDNWRAGGSGARDALFSSFKIETRAILREHWRAVRRIAMALRLRGELTSWEARVLFEAE
jgi:hypothetical protein